MITLAAVLLLAGLLPAQPQTWFDRLRAKFSGKEESVGVQVVPRDAFPVFHNPRVVGADEAEQKKYVLRQDPVIGVVIDGRARAYPIRIMGYHELGNDTLGSVPIAVTW
jgi:hypothetical protein